MIELCDKHRQDYSEIRKLCLVCHGLDLTGDKLFSDSTYGNGNELTKDIFNSTLSGFLLNLAIAIRVNIYQNNFGRHKDHFINHCGGIYDKDELQIAHLTIKDVCDKIIHADYFLKEAYPPDQFGKCKMCIQMKGSYQKRKWIMDLSIELFSEAVLNYLDSLENVKTEQK
jgi:hypothetical protein